MKRFIHRLNILLTALLFAGFSCSYGQGLQILPSDSFSYSGVLNTITDSHESDGFFGNNTGAAASISWRVISASLDSPWQLSFCDPEICSYITSPTNVFGTHSFTANTGSGNQFSIGAAPYCTADSGKLVVLAWLTNDSAASAKTIYYSASYTGSCVSSVQNVSTPQFTIYPNPINSSLTVEGITAYKNIKLTIFDVLGNVAVERNIAQPIGPAILNTTTLQNGVYFITVDGDGTRLLTRRIQKLD